MSLLVNATDSKNSTHGQDSLNADNHNPSLQQIEAFERFLNGRDTKGLDSSPSQPGDTLRALVEEGFQPRMLTTIAGSPSLHEALSKTLADFKSQFTEQAKSREGFHALLSHAFGNIDADKAEGIRLQSSKGNFNWLPKIELVSGDPTFRGAYSVDEGTVFLNPSLLDNPADALSVLTEEVGHHLETLVRQGDSPGDEGELFRRLFAGETLSRNEIGTLRRENDQGVVTLNGRGIQVEFETQDEGVTIIGGDGDDDAAGISIIISDGGSTGGGFSFGDLFDSSANDNEEFDFQVLPDGRGFVRARNRGFDHDILNATGSRQTGIQPYYNGRVIEETDGSWQFELVHISGTHNNYELVAIKTPYDDLVSTSGIDWQILDRAWLELTNQGNTEAAAQIRQGTLPPLELFSEGIQNELKSAQTAPAIDGPFANGGPIPGEEVDLGNGQKAVRVKSMDIDIIDASNAGPYINGRVIGPEEGFSNFRLEKIEGTHNNYTLLPDTTPYDELAQGSGIPWQELDRAYVDLKARGLNEQADLLQNDGVLPPLNAFVPGSPVETSMRAHYDRLAQQVAGDTGLPVDLINSIVNDLSTRDAIQASNLLQGKLETPQVLDVIVDTILGKYQVRDDRLVEYKPNLGPFSIDVPFVGSEQITQTEADLLDDLQIREGLLGLKEFRDITSNNPNDPGQAFRTADEYFPKTDAAGKPVRGDEDGHNDAFRHTFWNALMTKNFGEDFAAAFGTAHEGVPGNPADREAMDLFNNELGRRIATENPNASDKELADLVFEAVNNGEAVVINGSNDLAFSDQVAVGATGTADDPPHNNTLTPPPEGPGSI